MKRHAIYRWQWSLKQLLQTVHFNVFFHKSDGAIEIKSLGKFSQLSFPLPLHQIFLWHTFCNNSPLNANIFCTIVLVCQLNIRVLVSIHSLGALNQINLVRGTINPFWFTPGERAKCSQYAQQYSESLTLTNTQKCSAQFTNLTAWQLWQSTQSFFECIWRFLF